MLLSLKKDGEAPPVLNTTSSLVPIRTKSAASQPHTKTPDESPVGSPDSPTAILLGANPLVRVGSARQVNSLADLPKPGQGPLQAQGAMQVTSLKDLPKPSMGSWESNFHSANPTGSPLANLRSSPTGSPTRVPSRTGSFKRGDSLKRGQGQNNDSSGIAHAVHSVGDSFARTGSFRRGESSKGGARGRRSPDISYGQKKQVEVPPLADKFNKVSSRPGTRASPLPSLRQPDSNSSQELTLSTDNWKEVFSAKSSSSGNSPLRGIMRDTSSSVPSTGKRSSPARSPSPDRTHSSSEQLRGILAPVRVPSAASKSSKGSSSPDKRSSRGSSPLGRLSPDNRLRRDGQSSAHSPFRKPGQLKQSLLTVEQVESDDFIEQMTQGVTSSKFDWDAALAKLAVDADEDSPHSPNDPAAQRSRSVEDPWAGFENDGEESIFRTQSQHSIRRTATTLTEKTKRKMGRFVVTHTVPGQARWTAGELVEVIPDKLAFCKASAKPEEETSESTEYFSSDHISQYQPFGIEIGPLDLGVVVSFCQMLRGRLEQADGSYLVFLTGDEDSHCTLAAQLLASYLVLVCKKTAVDALKPFKSRNACPLLTFGEASQDFESPSIDLDDVIEGLARSFHKGWINVESFDTDLYETIGHPHATDMHEICPKLSVFRGPHSYGDSKRITKGVWTKTPEDYVKIFKEKGVTAVVRIRDKHQEPEYSEYQFLRNEVVFSDMDWSEGLTPSSEVIKRFFSMIGRENQIAIHSTNSLGRSCIIAALYLIKEHGFSAKQAIGWIRTVRPGSICGNHQLFLELCEHRPWKNEEMMGYQAVERRPYPRISKEDMIEKSIAHTERSLKRARIMRPLPSKAIDIMERYEVHMAPPLAMMATGSSAALIKDDIKDAPPLPE